MSEQSIWVARFCFVFIPRGENVESAIKKKNRYSIHEWSIYFL